MADHFRDDDYNSVIDYVLQGEGGKLNKLEKWHSVMKKRFIAFGCYTLFWLTFFFAARLFFILVQYHSSFQNSISDLLKTFWHGSKLDISTIGYYLLVPMLVAIPGIIFNERWYRGFLKWYSYFLIIFSSFIIVADANLYSYWGFRMDFTPILYLKTPKEALASVSVFKTIGTLFSVIAMSFIFIFFYNLSLIHISEPTRP